MAGDDSLMVDGLTKGIPPGIQPIPLGSVGGMGWNVLREDMTMPLAVLKRSALDHNGRWMARFLEATGTLLAPHGKTTMSPALFDRQLADGAWGITLATVQQVRVARAGGIGRIVLANQLVGRQAIGYIAAELARDPGFDFYCLVDSIDGVRQLADRLRTDPPGRPLQVMVEVGAMGGRTGCRTDDAALSVARAVKQAEPLLALRGVEGYEGMVKGGDGGGEGDRDDAIRAFLDRMVGVAGSCLHEDLFAAGPVILSAGGSAFYDMVAGRLGTAGLPRETLVVLRSGCYLTHDSKSYETMFQQIRTRMPEVDGFGPGPSAALEVWAYVQSRPQADKAILTVGKRDISYDVDLPVPTLWFRPGLHDAPAAMPPGTAVVELNDQHAHLSLPPEMDLKVGDMVAFGISHPCTTFDKWQVLFLVDDRYDIVSAVRTWF